MASGIKGMLQAFSYAEESRPLVIARSIMTKQSSEQENRDCFAAFAMTTAVPARLKVCSRLASENFACDNQVDRTLPLIPDVPLGDSSCRGRKFSLQIVKNSDMGSTLIVIGFPIVSETPFDFRLLTNQIACSFGMMFAPS